VPRSTPQTHHCLRVWPFQRLSFFSSRLPVFWRHFLSKIWLRSSSRISSELRNWTSSDAFCSGGRTSWWGGLHWEVGSDLWWGVEFLYSSCVRPEIFSGFVWTVKTWSCFSGWSECFLCRLKSIHAEPNLVHSHVMTSQAYRNTRGASRRREALLSNNEELHECTSPLLCHIRLKHVLPPNHEVESCGLNIYILFCSYMNVEI